MSIKLDGTCFKNMVDYAVRNLKKNIKTVNRLNVFPVPDGDTGTNMVTTIHNGLKAVGESIEDLSTVSKKFARSVVFEARGNSGVIVSQFLKGISEKFYDVDVADGALFIEALDKGVEYAYSSVATPVEGTMLTVIKDATCAVRSEFTGEQDVKEIIDSFTKYAKRSLEATPELLLVLKEAGVVDSGGAGIVYLFEGMQKYLDGESLDEVEDGQQATATVDYDAFDKNSTFAYGYCTELLLQTLNGHEPFDATDFKQKLSTLGNSLVVSVEDDKVRVHIHTHFPEQILSLCHNYGEFLSLKIENMTVQHTELSKRILCSEDRNDGAFSVVAVACDSSIQKLFIDMGADVSIMAEDTVSTKDYLDAFEKCNSNTIFVFPNSSDGFLSAMQAKKLYQKGSITVLKTRTIAECYAALPIIDFEEEDPDKVLRTITDVMNDLLIVSVAMRENAIHYRNLDIQRNEFYSFSGKELLTVGTTIEETAFQSIKKILEQQSKDVITLFYRPELEEIIDSIIASAEAEGICVDFFRIPVGSLSCYITLSFE